MAPAQMTKEDELHGGLVAPGFDEGSCLSRYESSCTAKSHPTNLLHIFSLDIPNPTCHHWNNSRRSLMERVALASTTEEYCWYVVWIANNGLGNKMLCIAAAFPYEKTCLTSSVSHFHIHHGYSQTTSPLKINFTSLIRTLLVVRGICWERLLTYQN